MFTDVIDFAIIAGSMLITICICILFCPSFWDEVKSNKRNKKK